MPETFNQSQLNKHRHQQNSLNSKLNERLGHSSVYFKRDRRQFFNRLSFIEQRKLLDRLKLIYSQILFDYFLPQSNVNDRIDRFVEEAFMVNLPMNKVVEIHMELIDSLERQLIFEGLHTEHISDFRLTLIDVIAHLGEMYRSVICKSA